MYTCTVVRECPCIRYFTVIFQSHRTIADLWLTYKDGEAFMTRLCLQVEKSFLLGMR
jgi:hypothetical protein